MKQKFMEAMKKIIVVIVLLFTVVVLHVYADSVVKGQDVARPSWSDYKLFFNKEYSTLSHELERQKIFLSNSIKSFMTQIKFKLKQLSYYTAINKYSDLTAEESAKMLNGAINDLNETDAMDDELAEQLLLEDMREDERTNGGMIGNEMVSKRRRKRSVEDEAGKQPDLRVRWLVESSNPDYKPIAVNGQLEVSESEGTSTTGMGLIKGAINGAIGWLSPIKWIQWREVEDEPIEITVKKDWRQSGCIGPAQDQGQCLSCYAITHIDYVQWAFCMSEGRILTPLSVQYVISCGKQLSEETGGKIRLEGCSGGVLSKTSDFLKEYGVELEANMPYLAQDSACPIAAQTARKQKGYIRPNLKTTLRLSRHTTKLDLALKRGPVVVSMRAPKDFVAYGGGIIEECRAGEGHAMLIVGSMSEDGVDYLLIKNSFGPSWGYDGYFKFRRSATPNCVIQFIVPRMSFPGKRSQQRRMKAYLARLGDKLSEPNSVEEQQHEEKVEIGTLFT